MESRKQGWALLGLMGAAFFASPLLASEELPLKFVVGNLWLLISAAMIFIMHLGFACLEAGLTQRKNTGNILIKNVGIASIGVLTYAIIGFNLMYPGEAFEGGFLGFAGFGVGTDASGLTPEYNESYTYWTDFIFQAMFAATAATIVSGAVAERIKIKSFFVFATVLLSLCYPIVGFWKWGGGFLNTLGTPFYDFAGSTIVHSVGGWAALAGVILLGPRIGKYFDGKSKPIHPHSLPLATIGTFLLWFGWYGFNGGSVLSADPGAVSLVFVTTTIAAAAGVIGSALMSEIFLKRFDPSMILNGALAGLVSITAGADQMGALSAAVIGCLGGIICFFAIGLIERLKLDDPVGAISVHLVCGIWGTLAVGIFGNLASFSQFVSQLIGVAAVGTFTFTAAFSTFFLIKKTLGLRVSEEYERVGLDRMEHGVMAYTGVNESIEHEKSHDTPREKEQKIKEVRKRA